MSKTRYRIYREHKYVSYVLAEFSRFVSKVDFTINSNIEEIIEKFKEVKGLMHGHAEHENTRIHELLRKKKSDVYKETESDHANHDAIFKNLDQMLTDALALTDEELKIELGHKFYLGMQNFEGENLRHQFHEETVIMPELQKLYTDEEILRAVDGPVYEEMTAEQMVEMIQVLFPHFNKHDREAFLKDIKQSQPEKFLQAWVGIMPLLDQNEQAYFISKFEISTLSGEKRKAEDIPENSSDEHVKADALDDKSLTLKDKPHLWSTSAQQAMIARLTPEMDAEKDKVFEYK